MDLFSLQRQLGGLTEYPLELWQPAFCGTVPIRIDRDGSWYFHGSPIKRPELVRLFAAVLSCVDGRYLLTTPAEQVQIDVDDAPFVLVEAVWLEDGRLQLTTNLQQSFIAGPDYPLLLQPEAGSGQLLPYLQLKRGLRAKFSRTLYYQLAEQAQEQIVEGERHYVLYSGDYCCRLG
ncbi:DUF1285 domain-containing protein [Rheinheimera texasensis]|jgi:hypothetical protein|uniref:DUF1285 domain-containing protein n=1 Tax=Rheinheimera texasensis TaxID=306205 RepID=UPI0004E19153|nr:DUF1285 domain-containing protein [Rheinheimera texasensis]